MNWRRSYPALIASSKAHWVFLILGATLPTAALVGSVEAQQAQADAEVIELTFERMVEYALNNSYQVRQLNMDIERTQLNLKSSQARLRSSVDLDFSLPTIDVISETRWDSDLQRNVIARENSRRMEVDLSVRQPVILFGYPTNGFLSLNSRLYKLTQREEDESDVRYYNRAFVSYTQPLFQANELKNDLEEAELALEEAELDFYGDVVSIIDDTSEGFFELFELAYEQQIREVYVGRLEEALRISEAAITQDPDRAIDVDRIRVELANAREEVTSNQSQFRFETSSLKTEFNIPEETEIVIDPVIELARVPIDEELATRYALELTPRMRQLSISHRESEIRLDNSRGEGGFELDVSLSYGREMQDPVFGNMWDRPENSYTVDVQGSMSLWDWGGRKADIRSEEIGIEQSLLRIEEATADITNDVRNEVRNVAEYENRAFNMQGNLALARTIADTSMERYEAGTLSALDLLQSLRGERDTEGNFLEAYLGWREALQSIQEMTYYDFERDTFLLDRFGISFEEGIGR